MVNSGTLASMPVLIDDPLDLGLPVATPSSSRVRADDRSAGVLQRVRETGGPPGLEPTRYGDWEQRGRCIDF
jgi:hypothetical protein